MANGQPSGRKKGTAEACPESVEGAQRYENRQERQEILATNPPAGGRTGTKPDKAKGLGGRRGRLGAEGGMRIYFSTKTYGPIP